MVSEPYFLEHIWKYLKMIPLLTWNTRVLRKATRFVGLYVSTWLSLATSLFPSGNRIWTEVVGNEASTLRPDWAAASEAAGSVGGGAAEELPDSATDGAMPPNTLPVPVNAFRTP